MKRYLCYTIATSFDREAPYYRKGGAGQVNINWSKIVLANSRRDAIKKCYPDLERLIGNITDPTIKFVSVFCGFAARSEVTGKADRLVPIQIDVSTRKIRETR